MSSPSTQRIEEIALERPVGQALLMHEGGLHARPSIKVTKLAKRFQSKVWVGVSAEGPWTDAKSIAKVMAMKTPIQTILYFAAEGDDAEQAVNALVALVVADFADAAGDAA
jgi:phosphocarrier protein HPr